MLAGLSPEQALATNKVQGSFGAATAAFSYARSGLVDLRRQLPTAALAFADTFSQARGTTDLIQGQRDYFGRHGFVRLDTGAVHQHGPWAVTVVDKVADPKEQ